MWEPVFGEQVYGDAAPEHLPPEQFPSQRLPRDTRPPERREPDRYRKGEPRIDRPQIDRAQLEQLHIDQPNAEQPQGEHGAPLHVPAEELRPAPAVWKQAHPSARRWAAKRNIHHGVGRAPSPPRMASGLLLAGLGAWLLLSFLPSRKPLTEPERVRISRQAGVDEDAWRFAPVLYQAAQGAAALYVSLGFLVAVRGLFFRRRIQVNCRRCQRAVVAERRALALRCETGRHSAGVNWGALWLQVAVLAVTIALIGLVVMSQLKIDFGLGLDFR